MVQVKVQAFTQEPQLVPTRLQYPATTPLSCGSVTRKKAELPSVEGSAGLRSPAGKAARHDAREL